MIEKILIANRGEIAIRVARTASDMGIRTVGVYSQDDSRSLHTRMTDETVALEGRGARPYLDIGELVRTASATGCDAVHPGYGFLSENADFAAGCIAAGLTFIGPGPDQLRLLGDKAKARKLAQDCAVPVLPGTSGPTTIAGARRLLKSLDRGGAIMLKAIAGGGGRGQRRVERLDALEAAFESCQAEAERAFGDGGLYAEQYLAGARHIEVQIVGDSRGAVSHLWDRECSLQRRRQKIIEIAPAVGVSEPTRENILRAATAMAAKAGYRNLGTFEFLVAVEPAEGERLFFLEANPRLQVEHTVTEEITGKDLVAIQIAIASGRTLEELGLLESDIRPPNGIAVQARVNTETMRADGQTAPASGTLAIYEPPAGPGVRLDGCGYAGYAAGASFDSLLAKVIVHSPSGELADAMRKLHRALAEFRIVGVSTNIDFLGRVLSMPQVQEGRFDTRFIEEHAAALAAPSLVASPQRFFTPSRSPDMAGARIDRSDPLAILRHGRDAVSEPPASTAEPGFHEAPGGTVALRAPLPGTILSIDIAVGEGVFAGAPVLVMDAMKMEHVVVSEETGFVRQLTVQVGDTVHEGAVLAFIEPGDLGSLATTAQVGDDLDFIRPDLQEVHDRQALLTDEGRPGPIVRRRASGQRTARENIDDLCDPGSFVEFGGLAVAARRMRNSVDELIRTTPADGLIMGTARVNGELFDDDRSRCAVLSYDPTVIAGTQGMKGHEKLDRMLELAGKSRMPVVFFTEGGGGRPGDSDKLGVGYNFIRSFSYLGQLSGSAPLIGVNNARCFAGNAFVLGCCDVVIATANSTIGVGGPALVEGAGLGAYRAEEIGPAGVHVANGVIDVLVEDEASAVATAKKYLAYFQGPVGGWTHEDQRKLRALVPENHRRVYDMRKLIAVLADSDSVVELRPRFGVSMITALIRIEGRPMGVIANNPHHVGGAIDSTGADKAARFMQLCNAFDLPIVSLCDTPGYMVGPEAEKTALIRHCARMVVVGSNLTIPTIVIVVRKGYGMGGLAMAGGSFSNCIMAASWPTGEFGGMAVEGFVKLGFRDQLAAIEDPAARQAKYEQMVAQMYEDGKALNAASFYEVDDVIDPKDTRFRITEALRSAPTPPRRDRKKLPWIDTW